MTDCKVVVKNLFEYLDKALDTIDCEELERHLELCRPCFDRVEFEKALRERLKVKTGELKASPECQKRIQDILKKFDK